MPVLEFEIVIGAPLEKVWAFFQRIDSLVALTPPQEQMAIESADEPLLAGARIVLAVKGPMRRARWVAKIVEHRPPHAVVFGEEARFVDEQEEGPFAFWRHEHEFERIDAKSTRVMDRITYRAPLGPIGWVGDFAFVRPKLRRAFRFRHEQMRKLLE
jgi:ligand-binding SRPBCC domain-containing protein